MKHPKLPAIGCVELHMHNTSRYVVLPLLCLALLVPCSASRAEQSPPRTISASGEATVYVRPDEVVVHVGIETFNAGLDEAKSANDAASKKLLAAIRDAGVEDEHVQTDVMQVQIDYLNDPQPSKGIEGYFCRRGYAVTLKDVSRFEQLVDVAITSGANHLMGFEFRTTELRKHRDQARKLAIRAARDKAVALAEELEMTVGLPRTIGEGHNYFLGYRSGWWGWGGGGYGQYLSQNTVQHAPSDGPDSGGETVPLGQIAIRVQISVTFDIAPTGQVTGEREHKSYEQQP